MGRYVQTLVSCEPDDPDLLTYDLGERLEVLAQVSSDWLFCASGGLEGLVRAAAVQPLSAHQDTPSALSSSATRCVFTVSLGP